MKKRTIFMKSYTADIRKILRETGFKPNRMWTNKYDNCRTVKAYAPYSDGTYKELDGKKLALAAERIFIYCKLNNIEFDVKLRDRSNSWFMLSSFIVRVPKQDL